MTKAQDLPKGRRGAFLAALRRMNGSARGAKPCEHGHYDCSTSEHGPCSNEVLGLIETEKGKAS